jgi:hypothetical protein
MNFAWRIGADAAADAPDACRTGRPPAPDIWPTGRPPAPGLVPHHDGGLAQIVLHAGADADWRFAIAKPGARYVSLALTVDPRQAAPAPNHAWRAQVTLAIRPLARRRAIPRPR